MASWSTYLSAIEDVAAARLFHAARPQTRFVFMGAGATWRPEEFRVGDHSIVLMGEPEHSLQAVAESWAEGRSLEGTPGVAWFGADGTCHRGGFRDLLDVSELPMPDRRLLKGRYRANRLSRGPSPSSRSRAGAASLHLLHHQRHGPGRRPGVQAAPRRRRAPV